MVLELSAANARLARPVSTSALPPKWVAAPKRATWAAHPAIIDPNTISDAAELNRSGCFIKLTPYVSPLRLALRDRACARATDRARRSPTAAPTFHRRRKQGEA